MSARTTRCGPPRWRKEPARWRQRPIGLAIVADGDVHARPTQSRELLRPGLLVSHGAGVAGDDRPQSLRILG
jgi:hypothetical protein